MTTTECPTCGLANVRNGREYEERLEWARAYYRRVHTAERCAYFAASRDARLAVEADYAQRAARTQAGMVRLHRYVAIFGTANIDAAINRWG